jgi:glucosamine--fructose-6-phosphate aminotransferase (isomerizing)
MRQLPAQIQSILDRRAGDRDDRRGVQARDNFLYLGRGYNFPAGARRRAQAQGNLYIHAEGYPAAEMKHGPIALIDEMMPVVFIAPHDAVFDKITSNIQEVKARKGRIDCGHQSRDEPHSLGCSTTSSASPRRSTC